MKRSAATFVIVALCSACVAPGPVAVPAADPTVTVAPGAGPTGRPVPQSDPTAPASYRPVKRQGRQGPPTYRGGNARFTKKDAVRYADGTLVRIVETRQHVEQGQGPGSFSGRPYTTLAVSVTNGSAKSIDLSQVVVTSQYGSPARLAAPVYENASVTDFSGPLQPGSAATAVYAFAIPTGDTKRVETIVDLDSEHAPAHFSGAVS